MRTQRSIIIAALLVPTLLPGCATVQQALERNRPTATLTDLRFENARLDSATLLFDVEIENHYPVALPLTNFDYTVSSRAEQFLSGNANSQTTVPAKSKKTVSLPVTVNYLGMLKALKGVRPGSKIPYGAELGLSVDTPALGRIRLPLKKEGELALPTVPGTEITDIWNMVKPK